MLSLDHGFCLYAHLACCIGRAGGGERALLDESLDLRLVDDVDP
jgi:hypothetical protein